MRHPVRFLLVVVRGAVRGRWGVSPLFSIGLIVLQLIGEDPDVVDCWEIAGAVRNDGPKSRVRNCRTLRTPRRWDRFLPAAVGERLVKDACVLLRNSRTNTHTPKRCSTLTLMRSKSCANEAGHYDRSNRQ